MLAHEEANHRPGDRIDHQPRLGLRCRIDHLRGTSFQLLCSWADGTAFPSVSPRRIRDDPFSGRDSQRLRHVSIDRQHRHVPLVHAGPELLLQIFLHTSVPVFTQLRPAAHWFVVEHAALSAAGPLMRQSAML